MTTENEEPTRLAIDPFGMLKDRFDHWIADHPRAVLRFRHAAETPAGIGPIAWLEEKPYYSQNDDTGLVFQIVQEEFQITAGLKAWFDSPLGRLILRIMGSPISVRRDNELRERLTKALAEHDITGTRAIAAVRHLVDVGKIVSYAGDDVVFKDGDTWVPLHLGLKKWLAAKVAPLAKEIAHEKRTRGAIGRALMELHDAGPRKKVKKAGPRKKVKKAPRPKARRKP